MDLLNLTGLLFLLAIPVFLGLTVFFERKIRQLDLEIRRLNLEDLVLSREKEQTPIAPCYPNTINNNSVNKIVDRFLY